MKCRYCDEEMVMTGVLSMVCPHCGTELELVNSTKEIIWTIEKYKDNIIVKNSKNNILKQL